MSHPSGPRTVKHPVYKQSAIGQVGIVVGSRVVVGGGGVGGGGVGGGGVVGGGVVGSGLVVASGVVGGRPVGGKGEVAPEMQISLEACIEIILSEK